MEIILASKSPRRAALLRQIGLPFRVVASSLEEDDVPVHALEDAFAARAVAASTTATPVLT